MANPKTGGAPPVACPQSYLLVIYVHTLYMYGGRLLHPRPEDPPWRGDERRQDISMNFNLIASSATVSNTTVSMYRRQSIPHSSRNAMFQVQFPGSDLVTTELVDKISSALVSQSPLQCLHTLPLLMVVSSSGIL